MTTAGGRVALYAGGGAAFHHAAILARSGHEIGWLYPNDVTSGALAGFDALVVPGGGYLGTKGLLASLGPDGARAVRSYVDTGGMYIGSCAGAFAGTRLGVLDPGVWNEGGERGIRSPGMGVLRAESVATDHPVMAGMPASFEIVHYNGPLFAGGRPLARVAARTERFTAWEETLGGSAPTARIDEAVDAGVANIVAGEYGRGRVVLFGSHPEFGFSVAMDDEHPPARMLGNAVAWQLAETGAPERPRVELATDRLGCEADAAAVRGRTARLRELTAAVRARGVDAVWLEPGHAMASFGRVPRQIWSLALDAIDRLAGETERRAPAVDPFVLGFRRPVEWQFDGGHDGVVALLDRALAQLDRALATWDFDPGEPGGHPFRHIETSPYQLVAGSYLAAVGNVAAAALLAAAHPAEGDTT